MKHLGEKVNASIQRMKAFQPPEGYLLAFSGGKDSVVLKALADMAGVKYRAHYTVTGIDPPELVYFVREKHPDVEWDIPKKNGKRVTMWNLIVKNGIPPSRMNRYCCRELKERYGEGAANLTGVRWAESPRRANLHGLITMTDVSKKTEVYDGFQKNPKGGIILNSDNDDARRVLETCYAKQKKMVNPIVDWEDSDIWEFIKAENVPYCGLYDDGFKRLGCIGCPMAGKMRSAEFARWPRYKQLYLNAFAKMQEERARRGKGLFLNQKVENPTPQDIFNWWMEYDVLPGQMGVEDFMGTEEQ